MNTLIVFAHPNTNSFNHALLEKVLQGLADAGHEARVKNLYIDNFNPVFQADELAQINNGVTPKRIFAEQEDVLWADSLIFIYPLWWFGPPAILKGWFDGVLGYDFAFKHHDGELCGLLTHSKALVIITAGSSEDWFKQQSSLDIIYRPVTQGTLEFCGVSNVSSQVFFNLSEKSDSERNDILDEAYSWGKYWDAPFAFPDENDPENIAKNNEQVRPLTSQDF